MIANGEAWNLSRLRSRLAQSDDRRAGCSNLGLANALDVRSDPFSAPRPRRGQDASKPDQTKKSSTLGRRLRKRRIRASSSPSSPSSLSLPSSPCCPP